jgi:hypothetical protein
VISDAGQVPLLSHALKAFSLIGYDMPLRMRFKATHSDSRLDDGVLTLAPLTFSTPDGYAISFAGTMRLTGEFIDFRMELMPSKALLTRIGTQGQKIVEFLGGKIVLPLTGSIDRPFANPVKVMREAIMRIGPVKGLRNVLGNLPGVLEKPFQRLR